MLVASGEHIRTLSALLATKVGALLLFLNSLICSDGKHEDDMLLALPIELNLTVELIKKMSDMTAFDLTLIPHASIVFERPGSRSQIPWLQAVWLSPSQQC